MIKTADIVKQLFLASDTAQLAAAEGLLNVSALAEQIQPQVEELTFKPVTVGTIRTALYRLLSSEQLPAIKPRVNLTELSIYPQVVDLTYDRQPELVKKIGRVVDQLAESDKVFFTVTEGLDEITIVADTRLHSSIVELLGEPRSTYAQLVAVNVRFDHYYLDIPNTMYALMAGLAVKHINVMEIVSTLTSLTFVVHEQELENTVTVLRKFLAR
jgi:hypothetical protein